MEVTQGRDKETRTHPCSRLSLSPFPIRLESPPHPSWLHPAAARPAPLPSASSPPGPDAWVAVPLGSKTEPRGVVGSSLSPAARRRQQTVLCVCCVCCCPCPGPQSSLESLLTVRLFPGPIVPGLVRRPDKATDSRRVVCGRTWGARTAQRAELVASFHRIKCASWAVLGRGNGPRKLYMAAATCQKAVTAETSALSAGELGRCQGHPGNPRREGRLSQGFSFRAGDLQGHLLFSTAKARWPSAKDRHRQSCRSGAGGGGGKACHR